MSSIKATLHLFNAIQIRKNQKIIKYPHHNPFLIRAIKNGYVLDPRIEVNEDLLDIVESVVGISGEKANSAFHKSWKTIQNTPQLILWAKAAVHYLTTYGFESLGLYQEDTIYIPKEELNIPGITEDMPITVVHALTVTEIQQRIENLGSAGIALKEETLDSIMEIVRANQLDLIMSKIKNQELRVRLFDYYITAPSDPVDYLRYLVYRLCGSTLLIKNKETIEKILRTPNPELLDELLELRPYNLSSIFLRYKPIFLAMKKISKNKAVFNRLRKEAKRTHIPLPEDYLNNVTNRIKHNMLDPRILSQKLSKVNIFRKIRLLNAVKFRIRPSCDSIVYRIRNGKGWVSNFVPWTNPRISLNLLTTLKIVSDSIIKDVRKNVEKKTIYIPRNVHYALPATEKQFTGFVPTGSYIEVENNLVFGIHWFNTKDRVDLDLSIISESGKIGWDRRYKTSTGNILFSGDMTSAPRPNGASELFYIKQHTESEPMLVLVNHYNKGHEYTTDSDAPVPTKILVGQDTPENFQEDYIVDPNKILMSTNIDITRKQNILGVVKNTNGINRFYFGLVSVGDSISCSENTVLTQTRKFLSHDLTTRVSLRDILIEAGAKVVDTKPDEYQEYIDLSPNALSKDSIIALLQK